MASLAPSESKIPTGLRPPLTGAVKRTLSGFSAPKLLQTKLKLPSLTRPKSVFQDSNKFKQSTIRDQSSVKSLLENDENKNESNSPNLIVNNSTDHSPLAGNLTFTIHDKSKESERTFTITKDEDIKATERNYANNTYLIEDNNTINVESKEYNTRRNEVLKLNDQIGKKVHTFYNDHVNKKVVQVSGILKYVGHVQTDGDIWCGIETEAPSKNFHDGSVNGVKYFTCKDNHGLLVPASQVKYQSSQYTLDPKILELKNKLQIVRQKSETPNLSKANVIDITRQLIEDKSADNHPESGPFSLLVGLDCTQIINNERPALNTTRTFDKNSRTSSILPPIDATNGIEQFKNSPMINIEYIDKFSNLADVKLIECESMIDLQSIDNNYDSVKHSNTHENTRLSNAYDSVRFIDNESMVDFVSINMDSMSNDAPRRSEILSGSVDCNTSKIDCDSPDYQNIVASTPDVHMMRCEKRKISSNENNSSSHESNPKQFVLGPLNRKQNSKEGSTEIGMRDCVKSHDNHVRISAENSEDLLSPTVSEPSIPQISKQNSFDESLGILTPDLMDSASFLDNVRSPSVDDFNDLLDNSKTTEKTVSSSSQTPSTENIKSLTPDALKSILSGNVIHSNKSDDLTVDDRSEKTCVLDDTISDPSNMIEPCCELEEGNFIKDSDYEAVVQLQMKQVAMENMCDLDLGASSATQNIEDELLPSVHSSILDPLSSVVDTTVNLDLPLDSRRYDSAHPQTTVRVDQTPSPEELPLDPVDLRTDLSTISVNQFCNSIIHEQSQADSDTKTDTTKSVTSKVSNSFITSITSITSLDGYQGDGEMSRPVSRGADQSPTIGHRGANNLQNHWQNIPINRRADPMTDSDFFTESDADGHDELIHRGDRRAQVIDGALYGGGNANNPPVMVNGNGNSNNEDSCMESSGVFTDMETHRCSPLLLNAIDDLSPEGSTPSTRSELSQKNNHPSTFYDGFNGSFNETVVAVHLISPSKSGTFDGNNEGNPKKLNEVNPMNPSDHNEDNSSNDKINKDERNMALKKYKMPRRDVASKVKTMMSKNPENCNQNKRPTAKNSKKGGRWDEVMNKISAGKSEAKSKTYLKDIKSKVTSRVDSTKKSFDEGSGVTSPKTRTPPVKLKSRRVRSRLPEATGTSGRSSPHSSQSDVSCGGPPPKHIPSKHSSARSAKKRDGRPLSPNNVPLPQGPPQPAIPTPPQQISPPRSHIVPIPVTKPANGSLLKKGSTVALNAARVPTPPRKVTPRRAATTLSPRQSPPTHKDHPRPPSPRVTPQVPVPALLPTIVQQPAVPNKGVEALAVLVQYLVFQLDALNAPRWKAQALDSKVQLSDATARLQLVLNAQATDHRNLAECLNKISELENELSVRESKYNASILSVTSDAETKYRNALEESSALSKEIRNLKSTLEQLQKDVTESRNIVTRCKKESKVREHHRQALEQEIQRLKKENEQLKHSQPGSKAAILSAEVESLKSVLELKLSELGEERRRAEQMKQAVTLLPAAQQRAQAAQTLADYLRAQLQRKLTDEANLIQQNKQMHDSYVQLVAQKNTLALHNEQLQYKLKHNSEVATLLAQSSLGPLGENECERLNHTFPETYNGRTNKHNTSFNEKYLRSCSYDDRTSKSSPRRAGRSESCSDKCDLSERNRTLEIYSDENSPPNSPKIKGVVEKNDSVSWIVEIPEAPEETASRLVRRANSFRNSSSPRLVRENLKRQRSRPKGSPISPSHPLSQSASASSLESSSQGGAHCKLFRSNSIEHKQYTSSPMHSSTPQKMNIRRGSDKTKLSESLPIRPRASSLTHDNRGQLKSLSHHERSVSFTKEKNADIEKAIMMAKQYDSDTLASNTELVLLQDCETVPKDSAGEALISGANSEDDSSLDDRSHSPSDSESVSESDKYLEMNGAGERLADPLLQKIAETMERSLSTTPMEVSWSEDGECLISETDI